MLTSFNPGVRAFNRLNRDYLLLRNYQTLSNIETRKMANGFRANFNIDKILRGGNDFGNGSFG
jgi:hypothetical protein